MDPCTTDTKTLLKQLTAQYYDDLNHAHERGQKVVWTNGLFPQEFFEAMDIQVAYPENLAATLGAKKGVMPYLEKCEALGYSSDLCSYTRIGLGYIESFDSDILNLPRPDMICNCTNICGLCVKWFECTAKRLDVPYVLIDTPYQTEYGRRKTMWTISYPSFKSSFASWNFSAEGHSTTKSSARSSPSHAGSQNPGRGPRITSSTAPALWTALISSTICFWP